MYKPIYENNGKDKAVSPIIATILIVAITVVLAATLYAVIGGYGGLIGKSTPTAGVSVTTSGKVVTVGVNSVSGNLSFADLKLQIDGSLVASFTVSGGSVTVTSPSNFTVTLSGVGGGYMTGLTTITVTGANTAATSLKLVDTSTQGTVFSWPS